MNDLEMKKLRYNFNRKAAKILAISYGITDKYECLTGGEAIPPDQID